VAATGVLVFWKESDVVLRIPIHLDLSVPPEALIYDVPKGVALTLVVKRGLVEISTQAVTSSDADVGDVVQVLLRPSGRALRAEIVAKDRAIAVEDGR
jgi:flagella basal body P-ring formation protein FlgA